MHKHYNLTISTKLIYAQVVAQTECIQKPCSCTTLILPHKISVWYCLQVERKKGQLVLTEETHREGVLAGSTYLNTMIEQHICNRLGSTVYNDWKKAKPVDAVKLIYDRVELQKRSFDGASPIKLEVPLSLLRVIPSEVIQIRSEH